MIQLRTAIDSIRPGLTDHDAERLRGELHALVAALTVLRPDDTSRHRKLSRREEEVMSMILSGKRLKEIAIQLDISVKTVTTHRARLLRKLGLEDNLGLYRYGIRNGLIGV